MGIHPPYILHRESGLDVLPTYDAVHFGHQARSHDGVMSGGTKRLPYTRRTGNRDARLSASRASMRPCFINSSSVQTRSGRPAGMCLHNYRIPTATPPGWSRTLPPLPHSGCHAALAPLWGADTALCSQQLALCSPGPWQPLSAVPPPPAQREMAPVTPPSVQSASLSLRLFHSPSPASQSQSTLPVHPSGLPVQVRPPSLA